jgi:hypothetical protein
MLRDLQDARRAAKTWLPPDDRDVTNGLVVPGPEGKPRCVRHGAMNRVDPYRSIWRCSEFRCGVGAELVPGVVSRVRAFAADALTFLLIAALSVAAGLALDALIGFPQ